MKRSTAWLLSAGVLLFVSEIGLHSLPAVYATLAIAGWGLLLVTLFHLLPLAVDAAAIRVLLPARSSWRDTVLARWAGESASSLLPFGQLAGPVVMMRQLWRRGVLMQNAVAAVTVSTTLQVLAQIAFALLGLALIAGQLSRHAENALRPALLVASSVLAVLAITFYALQRRGLFTWSMRAISRFCGKRDWSSLHGRAREIDEAVHTTYRHGRRAPASFLLNLAGWIAGTGEVYLLLQLFGTPVTWGVALMLESVGQAIRGAAFAIPGALGVQEGGYLLLAPLAGLHPDTALALSLAKRAREVLLGVPGLLHLHASESLWRPRPPASTGE
ncbi:MAG TPA: lysylphosphatidylglycerol synthase domain-containing protein [Steroidobacteraceae bacterium]